jgi:MFS family permease
MQRDMPITYQELNISSAVNSVGTAVGCLLFIPLSIKYGRRSIYLGSFVVMLAMAIWTALARNKWDIYFTNLFFGMAGSTNETIVQMTVRRVFTVREQKAKG